MASRLTMRYVTVSPDALGKELRDIRTHLDISQRLFASRLGVHRTSLARWEAGARPTPLTVLHLARFLAEAHVPPVTFIPDPRARQVALVPTNECWWRDYAGITCDGAHAQLQCQARLAARKEARRQAQEGTTVAAGADPPST